MLKMGDSVILKGTEITGIVFTISVEKDITYYGILFHEADVEKITKKGEKDV